MYGGTERKRESRNSKVPPKVLCNAILKNSYDYEDIQNQLDNTKLHKKLLLQPITLASLNYIHSNNYSKTLQAFPMCDN